MFKRIISFGLCLVMFAMLFASCGQPTTTTVTNPEDLPATINLIGITEKTTTQEAIDFVEEALNKLSKTRYKTRIELTLVTADEYMAEIDKRVAEANQATIKLAAITKYNALAVKEANNAQKLLSESNTKKSKWTNQVTSVVASTMTTGEVYSAEQTTVYEDGKIETVYPSAQSPIDILMIDGKEMYEELEAKGYLLSVKKKLDEKFTKFRQYIYPTFFEQLEAMTGDIKAIPNNNLLAEYTYVVIDKTIADAYNNGNGFNIDNVDDYSDLEAFLGYVKANYAGVAPLATEPEALGIYQYMEGELAIGTYYDPIYGYDTAEGTDFQVQNLLAIPEYQAHVALMQKYNAAGYIVEGAENYAVNVIKGNAYVAEEYGDDYYVKVVQNPFVEPDAIFDGMFAVSAFTSSEDRALEIIEMFTTDPEAKNIFQYGIADNGDNTAYANYRLVETEERSGKFIVQRLNDTYMMDNGLTGNVYMGYPDPADGQPFDAWTYYKNTNLDSGIAPFLHLYVEESALDNILTSVLKRAALTDALSVIDIDYNKYVAAIENAASPDRNGYIDAIRKANIAYFVKELEKADTDNNLSKPLQLVTTSDASAAVSEFSKFIQSAEGQAVLLNAGYVGTISNAAAYAPVASLSGEITILANVGTSTKDYFDTMINALIEAFTKMYPNVTIVKPNYDPTNGYSDKLDTVNNANKIGFTHDANASGKVLTKVAKSYLDIVLNRKHDNFPQMWYENKLIAKVTAEQYADIVSASDLQKLVENKVAVLAGAAPQKDKGVVIQDSERTTLATARKKAQSYYTNIDYLRVMVNETLFNDDPENAAKYAAMTDADFVNGIFEYVRANYEKENNLTEEEYLVRVQNFMVSVLEYTSKEDSSVRYLVSWDEFVEAEEGSKLYETAASTIKSAYEQQLKNKLGYTYAILSLDKMMETVYEIMTEEYQAANGIGKSEFKAMIQNKYLNAVKSDAESFATYDKNSDEYKNIVSKLRKKFKAILIENFSETAYKNGEKGISNEKVLDTLYNHFVEEELGNYNKMADLAGVNVNEFRESEVHYANYAQYISTLKTKYVYTLRTQYTDSQISAWTLEEAKNNIFKILEEKGFYTNELAKYIGLTLTEYMIAESDAKAYNDYMATLAGELATQISAKGYDINVLLKGDGTELEAIAYDIVADEYFSDKLSVSGVLKAASAPYIKEYTDAEEMKADAEILSQNAFFNAVVNELQSMWETKKAESAK